MTGRALSILVLVAAAACGHGASDVRPEHPAQAAPPAAPGPDAIAPSQLSPEQVRLVQRALSDRGFAVEVNGQYDAATAAAVTEFQRTRGLAASGALGPSTIESLGLDARELAPRAAPPR